MRPVWATKGELRQSEDTGKRGGERKEVRRGGKRRVPYSLKYYFQSINRNLP